MKNKQIIRRSQKILSLCRSYLLEAEKEMSPKREEPSLERAGEAILKAYALLHQEVKLWNQAG